MSVATDIAARITAEIGGGVQPWSAVGDALAARLGRMFYYFSAAAAGTFPQSLQGASPTPSVLTASPTKATPAVIAQAAMPVGAPNLTIWPAHTMLLHLWTFAPLLPTGQKYSVLATLKQVDASGATIATLKSYPLNGDPDFPDDIWSRNWARTDLAVDLPQYQGEAGLRLEMDLTLFTSCVSALVVQLQLGGEFASYIDTSLVAAGGGGSNSVESLDGSIIVTSEGGGVQDLSVAARPVPTLTKRYYLTGVGSDISGDYLFSTTQPAAADLQPPGGSTYPIILDSPVGAPGLVTWPAGIVMAHIVARVVNAHISDTHMQYPMSFGTGDESAAMLARGSYPYQVAPWPALVYLTADYQTFVVPVNVQNLDGSTADRLRCWLRCNPQGGTITDEQFEIHLGDSYFDTLFTPSSGATVHNDLTGRGYSPDFTQNDHPQWSITDVASVGTVTDGNLDIPVGTNIVEIPEGATVSTVNATFWPGGTARLTLYFPLGGHVTNQGAATSPYVTIKMGNFGGLSGAQGEQLDLGNNAVVNLLLIGGVCILDGAPNVGTS